MAKNKINPIEGYFFMSIIDSNINIDCSGDDDTLAKAFASIIISNNKKGNGVKSILATAIAIAAAELEPKEKKTASKKKANG